MAGMLQIITYLLAFYLVMKGVEIFQIGLASGRESRSGMLVLGGVSIVACIAVSFLIVKMQDDQALSLQQSMSQLPVGF